MAIAARESSRRLQAMPAKERSKILLDIADALEANEKMIVHENEADVAAAKDAGYETSRLALKPEKVAKAIRVLANMDEPNGQILKRREVSQLFARYESGIDRKEREAHELFHLCTFKFRWRFCN